VHSESSNLYTTFVGCFPSDRSAVLLTTDSGRSYSYADAERLSAQVANCLMEMGLRRGDRVTTQVEKSPEVLFLYLGVLRAGLVFHPLNTAYTREELAYFLQDAAPSLVVCDPGREALFGELCGQGGGAKLLTLDAAGEGSLWDLVQGCHGEFATAHNEPGDMAALLYSSGTTGRPKGIMLSHENLGHNASVLREYWGFEADDTLLHALPTFHVHGLFVAIGCVLMSGSCMRWLPAFDVAKVMQALPQCTVMMGVPTYYTRLLAESSFGPDTCARVRLFISGSAPLLADTFEAFRQRTGKTILERYGMSETGMLTSNPLDGERRAGTVGFPLPGVDVRVVGPGGEELATGEVGDIQVRGANVFSGYWNLPEKTAEDFTADGFFNTGDQGRFDVDGYLAIVGRAKDMIITGGLNVYPKEVELLIDDMPGVKESAIIGLPHPDFGEAVTAVVVPEAGAGLRAEEVIAYVKDHAAKFKVPKTVHFVDSLPRNTMGKVQKNMLRDQLA
jgi:malonyl-CoA/methylmalonyl-CoA synthetase